MPSLFRIMGGGNSSSSNSSNNNNSRSSSRYTYPGQRASAAPALQTPQQPPATAASATRSLPSSTTLPEAPPRTGGALASSAPPQVVLRGSHVAAPNSGNSSRAPPPAAQPLPNSSNSNNNNDTASSSRPGAYQVTRTSEGPAQVYRVTVPMGVRPGAEFTVHAGPRRVRVRCPPTSRPGQSLQITLPPEPVTHHLPLRMAPLTALPGNDNNNDDNNDNAELPTGGAVPMTPDVRKVNQQAAESGGTPQTFLVQIPANIYAGMQFTVNVAGQRFMVTCPATAGPHQKVRIVPPVQREEPQAAPTTQVFEVAVPPGVRPGQPFALVANSQRVLVTCPPNVVAGQKIRFQLPVSQVVGNIELQYESETGGWRRTVRVTDLKFQWVRLDGSSGGSSSDKTKHEEEDPLASTAAAAAAGNNVDVEGMERFDFQRSAYVRKLVFLEGNDARMRTGQVELVPAQEAVVDSRLVVHNRTLLSYADIAAVQGKPLSEKMEWFHRISTQLTSAWEDGHIKLVVRRQYLLLDSVDAVMSLGRDDLRKRWRIEFLGEPGIDAGGVSREWFELVTEQIFDPAFGLWVSSVNNQACVNINPASGTLCVLCESAAAGSRDATGTCVFWMILLALNSSCCCCCFILLQLYPVPTITSSTFDSWDESLGVHCSIANSSRVTWCRRSTSTCWDGPLRLKTLKHKTKNTTNLSRSLPRWTTSLSCAWTLLSRRKKWANAEKWNSWRAVL